MGCDTMIYEAIYENNGNIELKCLDTIRGYDFLDLLPLEITVNNGFFEIPGNMLQEAINLYGSKMVIDTDKDYMISISY